MPTSLPKLSLTRDDAVASSQTSETFDGGVGETVHALGSSAARRRSRISRASAAQASIRMAKLASATPMASQRAGIAVSEIYDASGSGMIAAAPIAVKWWLQIASVNSSAPVDFHFADAAGAGRPAARRADHGAEHDRTATSIGSQRIRPCDLEGRHAGVVHRRDAAADDRAADDRRERA